MQDIEEKRSVRWQRIKEELSWPMEALTILANSIFDFGWLLWKFGDYRGTKIGSSYIMGIMFSFIKMTHKEPGISWAFVPLTLVIVVEACTLIFWVLGWILFGITSVLEGIISYIKKTMIRRQNDEM